MSNKEIHELKQEALRLLDCAGEQPRRPYVRRVVAGYGRRGTGAVFRHEAAHDRLALNTIRPSGATLIGRRYYRQMLYDMPQPRPNEEYIFRLQKELTFNHY